MQTIEVRRNLEIPLADGVRLAADLYLPPGQGPFPTLVSYYPYHKDDYIGVMCDFPCRTFAQHGYAGLVVDFRGTGASEGIAREPFDPGEAADGAEIVEWAAAQDWSNGRIGMWGISYGAVAALQTATRRPRHLEAIVAEYACTDAYGDFVYPGGCLNCLSAFGSWGSLMLAMQLMPPATGDAEGRWQRVWNERLDTCTPYSLSWHQHRERDEYWHRGMIPVENVEAATLLIGGWRELFPESMMQTFGRLRSRRKMLMGPWGHFPPDFPLGPEPVDHLQEMLRWWDRWLRDERNGVEEEAPLTFFLQGENEWRRGDSWPPEGTEDRRLFLADGGRLIPEAPPEEAEHGYTGVPTTGAEAGLWELMALGVGQPLDQGPDDLRSLTFTSDPLPGAVDVCGSPQAALRVTIDGAEAHLVAKLCDVAPDGRSVLVTTGWLRSVGPAPDGTMTIRLWATAYRFAPGHRIRLSIAASDFPRIFPARTNPTIRVGSGGARGSLLSLPAASLSEAPEPIRLPRPDPTVPRVTGILEAIPKWTIERDPIAGKVTITSGLLERFLLPAGGRVRMEHDAVASVTDSRPDGAKVDGNTRIDVELPAGERVRVETATRVTFGEVTFSGEVHLDGRRIFEKRWKRGA